MLKPFIETFEQVWTTYQNKLNNLDQKSKGQFYTPIDSANLIGEMVCENYVEGDLCDVACGCGNLILNVLNTAKTKYHDVYEKMCRHKIYLYDCDEDALNICKWFLQRYFDFNAEQIISVVGDFLTLDVDFSKKIVITNPPYVKSRTAWKNLYIEFIVACLQHHPILLITLTPQDLVKPSQSKLWKVLNDNYGGEMYFFDNVPGSLFANKNICRNETRAAIGIFKHQTTGFRLSYLIRFNNDERSKLLHYAVLKQKLGQNKYDQNSIAYFKCPKSLEPLLNEIQTYPYTFKDLVSKTPTAYKLCVPNSIRYFISAYDLNLNRSGKLELYAKDETAFYWLFLLCNSSYAYWWYRITDGGFTISMKQFLNTIFPFKDFTMNDQLVQLAKNLLAQQSQYIQYKMNAHIEQATVNFSLDIRQQINHALFPKIENESWKHLHAHRDL